VQTKNKMSDVKILLTYKAEDGSYQVESVWATKEGEYYRIDNIPFLAANVALYDLVTAEMDDGQLYFDELIQASGHSTIQMIIYKESELQQITSELEKLGCAWEGSHIKTLIAIDVPKDTDYSLIEEYLESGERANRWSYKEACMAHDIER